VHGVEANVIRDGMILLAKPHSVLRKRGNVHVYDFGTREAHDHDHDHALNKRDKKGKVSCYKCVLSRFLEIAPLTKQEPRQQDLQLPPRLPREPLQGAVALLQELRRLQWLAGELVSQLWLISDLVLHQAKQGWLRRQ
jgi:hypothetical protein